MAYAIDLWKIVLDSNCSKETRINIKNGLDELNAKAKAFDGIRNIDKDFYEEYGYSPNEEEWWYEANNIFEKYKELYGGQIT